MKRLIVTLAVTLLFSFGCRQAEEDAAVTWKAVAESEMTPKQSAQREEVHAARDEMLASLKGRLMEVVSSEGPAAAIVVCSKEAPQIAQRVSEKHGLTIRRTSFRLRNSDNSPPVWAEQLVADRVGEPVYLAREGKLAALLPIRIQAQCLMCHGSDDTIPPTVKEALAKYYPQDQATGFNDGDLRGWFCVEVPDTGGT